MRGVDLHPEDLLEREACGALTPAEAERLRAHLEVCEVCRFERLARRDVRAEVDEAEEVDVQRLLATVLTPEMLRRPAIPTMPPARRRAMRPRVLLLAAAMLTIASVAGAAGWTELLREKVSGRHPAIETQTEAPAHATTVGARPPVLKVAASGPAATADPVEESPVGTVAPAVEPPAPEVPLAAAPPAPVARVTTRVAGAHGPQPVTSNVVPAATAPAPEPPVGAAGLFDRANEARHAGDRAGAMQGYRALLAQYPASAEAHEALAALGKMLLDGGDGGAAVRCFDDYLRAGGPLRQDVMADRALALQRLGRTGDEAAAWSALLASYPASVHAERARRRLAELEKP